MQTQTSFAELEFISKKKLTRRDRFLAEIEAATPWAQLVAVIEPHYPKGARGRAPMPRDMIRAKGAGCKGGRNRPLFTPDDHIPATCGPIFGQSASAAALKTGGRGLFSGSLAWQHMAHARVARDGFYDW
jgi:IS5 family transposase